MRKRRKVKARGLKREGIGREYGRGRDGKTGGRG
jgi:hypothetical protein